MDDATVREILAKKPFAHKLHIKEVHSLKGRGAVSGESFKLIDTHNNAYKLRMCGSEHQAKKIEQNVKRLPHAFPKFYGREGTYLLFDWVKGELWYDVLTEPLPLQLYYQLGKLVGEAHALEDVDKEKTAEVYVTDTLKILEEQGFEKKLLSQAKKKLAHMQKKLRIDVVLDINDIHPRNFMITHRAHPEKARVFFVDEDGFGHKIKGLGLAKPFFIEGMINTREQQDAFWKGYHEHHSSDYFDKEYQAYVTLVQLIRSAAVRSKKGVEISKLIEEIEKRV